MCIITMLYGTSIVKTCKYYNPWVPGYDKMVLETLLSLVDPDLKEWSLFCHDIKRGKYKEYSSIIKDKEDLFDMKTYKIDRFYNAKMKYCMKKADPLLKDLLCGLLQVNPFKRLTMKQALEYSYFKKFRK